MHAALNCQVGVGPLWGWGAGGGELAVRAMVVGGMQRALVWSPPPQLPQCLTFGAFSSTVDCWTRAAWLQSHAR